MDRKLISTQEILEEIRRKVSIGVSKRNIAKEMNINESTLRKRLKDESVAKSLGRYSNDIPMDTELELARQVKQLDARFYGITKDLQIAAYKFADGNNITQHRFNRSKKIAGTYIPPALIFPRKRMKDELFLNAPTGTCKMVSESGFINSELFCHWLVHFKNNSRPSVENPVLLILDNHSSHRDLGASLDIAFFGLLKCAYSHECNKWIINNPGEVITQLQVGKLFSAAYIAISNIEKALDSFKASGISPFNPDKFQDVDFAPSLVTDMPRSIDKETETAEETTHPENVEVEQAAVEVHSVIEKSNIEGVKDHCPDILNLEVECKDGIVIPSIEDTPHNMSCQNRPRGKSRAQISEILSSSPLKNKLEELEDTKRMKPVKK
ncbi:hypothetical protein ILUMI_15057, partial [Ignelater luminosus]